MSATRVHKDVNCGMSQGTATCFYSGYSYRNSEEVYIYQQRYSENKSLTREERALSRKYALSTQSLK